LSLWEVSRTKKKFHRFWLEKAKLLHYRWYEFCMNRWVNCSISRSTPFGKTCNEKLKWNTNVYVRTCRCDVYEYTYVVSFLRGCYVVKLHEVRINESISFVTCRSTLLRRLCVIARPNMPNIVRFGPYRHHVFVLGDASPLLSLTPQNVYNRSVASTTHKAPSLDARFRCGISQPPI
jgi:hypothetical protein